MDYQLNYFFEDPVDLIKKYGSEILSLLKVDLLVLNGIKNDKVEISLEEVVKMLMNFDLKVLPKQEILREEYILNKEIPINNSSYNNKVKKF